MPPRKPRVALLIMAAGKGTRLKSKHPKVLHRIGGRALIEHVLRAALKAAPAEDVFIIVGHEADKVREAVSTYGVNFILQAEQRGTGHAILTSLPAIAGYDHVLVLSGDTPLLRPETLDALRDFHLAHSPAMTILTAVLEDPFGYGRIIRRSPSRPDVTAIVEQKSLKPSQQKIAEINSSVYAFSVPDLEAQLVKLTTDNPHGEYYLTDTAALLVKARRKVLALPAPHPEEVLGANTLAELEQLDVLLRRNKTRELMASGVTIFRPDTCLIDADVQIGADTVVDPFVQILGNTRIGEDCRIRSQSVISDAQIGNGVHLRPGCIVEGATIADKAILGPYCHIRPGSEIGEGAHVGNFVETKKVRLGKGSKANHLTYLGDAVIGEGVNVGAGTITCNYDGVHKHTTHIGDGVFVGSDATLVAPVTIGAGAYVAAGSCITEDVPPDSLAIARGRQIVKPDWARQRRTALAAAKKK